MFVLKKEREREETTKLIHVGKLDKVIHFIQKRRKKEPDVFTDPLYFQCVFPDVFVGLTA